MVSLVFLVTYCVQVWTEQSEWRLRGSRGGRDPHAKLHPQIQKTNTETCAHKTTKTKTVTKRDDNTQTSTTNTTNTTKTDFSPPPSHQKRTRELQTQKYKPLGDAPAKHGLLLRSGLFVQTQQHGNHETRQFSGVPNGAGCSLLIHIRGVPKKRLNPYTKIVMKDFATSSSRQPRWIHRHSCWHLRARCPSCRGGFVGSELLTTAGHKVTLWAHGRNARAEAFLQ